MQDILDKYWLEFLNNQELDTYDFQEQLGHFWMWYQEKKSNFKPPKIVEKVVYRDSNYSGGNKIYKF